MGESASWCVRKTVSEISPENLSSPSWGISGLMRPLRWGFLKGVSSLKWAKAKIPGVPTPQRSRPSRSFLLKTALAFEIAIG